MKKFTVIVKNPSYLVFESAEEEFHTAQVEAVDLLAARRFAAQEAYEVAQCSHNLSERHTARDFKALFVFEGHPVVACFS